MALDVLCAAQFKFSSRAHACEVFCCYFLKNLDELSVEATLSDHGLGTLGWLGFTSLTQESKCKHQDCEDFCQDVT
jgi:hypothetical protein